MFSMNCITFNLNLHQRNQKLKQLSSEAKEEGLRTNPKEADSNQCSQSSAL